MGTISRVSDLLQKRQPQEEPYLFTTLVGSIEQDEREAYARIYIDPIQRDRWFVVKVADLHDEVYSFDADELKGMEVYGAELQRFKIRRGALVEFVSRSTFQIGVRQGSGSKSECSCNSKRKTPNKTFQCFGTSPYCSSPPCLELNDAGEFDCGYCCVA